MGGNNELDPVPVGLTPAELITELEAGTPVAVALSTGAYVTVSSHLVDSYGTRGGRLQLTKTDGSRISRTVQFGHNGTTGADATTATIESRGLGTHADFNHTTPDWLDVDLSGVGTAQVIRLRVKAGANGASWAATFYPDFLKAA